MPGTSLMTAKEAASYYRVNLRTIYVWASQDPPCVPCIRIGRTLRFVRDDVMPVRSEVAREEDKCHVR